MNYLVKPCLNNRRKEGRKEGKKKRKKGRKKERKKIQIIRTRHTRL
jgi:hypothetical protein